MSLMLQHTPPLSVPVHTPKHVCMHKDCRHQLSSCQRLAAPGTHGQLWGCLWQ